MLRMLGEIVRHGGKDAMEPRNCYRDDIERGRSLNAVRRWRSSALCRSLCVSSHNRISKLADAVDCNTNDVAGT